jgi:hypothetical protein
MGRCMLPSRSADSRIEDQPSLLPVSSAAVVEAKVAGLLYDDAYLNVSITELPPS